MPDTPDTPDSPQTRNLPAPAALPVPAFAPVPRLKARSNGWKPEVQRAFIAALAETGSVRAACKRVGRADRGAYQLRNHPEAGEFRAAWDAALDLGVRRIEDAAMDRALYGTEETIHYHGNHVATRRRYNERLVMFILRNRAPERFAEGKARGLNAIDKMELARLKARWRKEWEKEEGARRLEHEKATIESINAKIDALREKRRLYESPRTTALRDWADGLVEEAKEEGLRNRYCGWYDPEHEMYRGPKPGSAEDDANGLHDDVQSASDAAGTACNGPIALPSPRDADEAGEEPRGPRVRTLKDDGW